MSTIPDTLREFKNQAQISLEKNLDSADIIKRAHLKINLVETNTKDVPNIQGFSDWKPLSDAVGWYVASNSEGHIILNKLNDRIWVFFTSMRVEDYDKRFDSWIKNNLRLDNCWIPLGAVEKIGKSMNWKESGVGLRYENKLADGNYQASIKIKARYGQSEDVMEDIKPLRDKYPINSVRYFGGDSPIISEWYTDGRITINAAADIDSVFESVWNVSEHYHRELADATKLRDKDRGFFEFKFNRTVDLNRYSEEAMAGKGNLNMWLLPVETRTDFLRLRGVDLHTWDRVHLDLSTDYAYMTIPDGCVNAVPRLASIQGENVLGKTRIFYDGNRIFE